MGLDRGLIDALAGIEKPAGQGGKPFHPRPADLSRVPVKVQDWQDQVPLSRPQKRVTTAALYSRARINRRRAS